MPRVKWPLAAIAQSSSIDGPGKIASPCERHRRSHFAPKFAHLTPKMAHIVLDFTQEGSVYRRRESKQESAIDYPVCPPHARAQRSSGLALVTALRPSRASGAPGCLRTRRLARAAKWDLRGPQKLS